MKNALTVPVCLLVTLFIAQDAAAQLGTPWTDRGYANFNIGFESATATLTDAGTRRIYDEDATFAVTQAIDSGVFFDISAGARVWRNVSVGIGFHQESTDTEASVQGSVPSPLRFNDFRTFTTNVGDLQRTERAVHLQIGYMLPLTDRVDAHVLLGPSFFSLSQEVVGDIAIQEAGGNFSQVNATPASTDRTESAVGFNVGVDVAFRLLEMDDFDLGAGILLRWAGASADVQLLQNEVDSDLGGFHFAVGARLRF